MTRADLYGHVRRNPGAGWPADLLAEVEQADHAARRAAAGPVPTAEAWPVMDAEERIESAPRRPRPLRLTPVVNHDAGDEDWRGLALGVVIGLLVLTALAWAWGA